MYIDAAACTIMTFFFIGVALLVIPIFLKKYLQSIDRELKDKLQVTGVVFMIFFSLLGLGVFSKGLAYSKHERISVEKIEIYKTPLMYVVGFDKEEYTEYDDLKTCKILDSKDSLYFYKRSYYNFFHNIVQSNYIFTRKEIREEEKEN